jgi:hypothetical protein
MEITTRDNIRYKNKSSACYDGGIGRTDICSVSINNLECFTFSYIGVTVTNLLLFIILLKIYWLQVMMGGLGKNNHVLIQQFK